MTLRITAVTINRDVHPNAVFVVLQNPAGESAKVQIHFEASMNVNDPDAVGRFRQLLE